MMTNYRQGNLLLHSSTSLLVPASPTNGSNDDNPHTTKSRILTPNNELPTTMKLVSPKLKKSRYLVHELQSIEKWTKEHYDTRRRIQNNRKQKDINDKKATVAAIKLQAFVRSGLTRVRVRIMVEKLIDELIAAQQHQQQNQKQPWNEVEGGEEEEEDKEKNEEYVHDAKDKEFNSIIDNNKNKTDVQSYGRDATVASSTTKPERRNVGKVERKSHQRQSRATVGQPQRPTIGPRKSSFRHKPNDPNHHHQQQQQQQPIRRISFSSQPVEEHPVTTIPRSKSDEFYYNETDIARFRHYAFVEDAGLDPNEFPFDE